MIIFVNNEQKTLPEACTISQLLERMGYRGTVAVWVNEQQLLQRDYPLYGLQERDQVKIVRPLGGG